MPPDIHLYQIAYNEATRSQIEGSGFLMLDNLANPRPDWYEYWPMRSFLLNTELDDEAFYGVFSPKFTAKTQMTHTDVVAFIQTANAKSHIDVALFSPQPDMGANFLNVFEQAEVFDPGFMQATKDFLQAIGVEVPVESMVMDSRHIVYSNYFVARPAFWRLWFAWTEKLFALAEQPGIPLHQQLCHSTNYAENAQRKVFLMERLASLLLIMHREFVSQCANPFGFGWSMARFRERPHQTYINDALKRAYVDTGFEQYMQAFIKNRADFVAER